MTLTVKAALQQSKQRLSGRVEDIYSDSYILMSDCLGKDRAWLIAHDDDILDESQFDEFMRLVRERARGVPVAHLTGTREFWSMRFAITPDTLIPRPETEHLIERALGLSLPPGDINVLDFGTGSGIIAITLAKERPDWKISAIECSTEALQIARKNASTHRVEIDFIHASHLQSCKAYSFDLIISNPPYIKADDPHLSRGDVRFEPLTALASGSDGLDCIRYLVADAPGYLKPAAYLVLEHGYDQASAVQALLQQAGFRDIVTQKDLAGHERITSAQWMGDLV